MNAEKTAVLVVTGIVAVLLALTLARSRPEPEPSGSAPGVPSHRPLEDPAPRARFVKVKPQSSDERRAGGQRRVALDPESKGRIHRIRDDETFESLAARFYGRRSLAHVLVSANPHLDPRRLGIGTEVLVPRLPESPGQRPLERARPRGRQRVGAWHVVRSGERLESIARARYGRRSAWKRIYAANRDQLESPDLIREGMRLRIP